MTRAYPQNRINGGIYDYDYDYEYDYDYDTHTHTHIHRHTNIRIQYPRYTFERPGNAM